LSVSEPVSSAPDVATNTAATDADVPSLAELLARASDGGDAAFVGGSRRALPTLDVRMCEESDGPHGAGHLRITFAPDGSVVRVVVDAGPFVGTRVGACVADRYRSLRVPRGTGGTVGKSFVIN
jgi:hypothetical protein